MIKGVGRGPDDRLCCPRKILQNARAASPPPLAEVPRAYFAAQIVAERERARHSLDDNSFARWRTGHTPVFSPRPQPPPCVGVAIESALRGLPPART